MKKSTVRSHFDAHADDWIEYGYRGNDHVYPTARHRTDAVCRIIDAAKKPLKIADLGCGGGNLSIRLAELGHRVTGIDQSAKMVSIAEATRAELPAEIRHNLEFACAELEEPGLPEGVFDAVVAMGVIGYLDSDAPMFSTVSSLLRPGGTFAVSSRNRLFNMNSLSFRTVQEIKNGSAARLIDEISQFYKPIPAPDVEAFVTRFKGVAEKISLTPSATDSSDSENHPRPEPTMPALEARQHTPQELIEIAEQFAFEPKALYGIHPHLIDPNFNKLLPPGLFNSLCECLDSLSHLPISLVWSSVFIAEFVKPETEPST